MLGLFPGMRILRDLVEYFFLFTKLELESLFFLLSPDAHFHILSRLPFAHPSPERAGHVAAVPIHNHVSRTHPGFRGGAAIVDRARRHRASGVTLSRKSEHRPLVFDRSQFKSGEP
jgi:hypothetical protein